ncbi:MAG: tetratricopeptide repeat protein [Thermodesulfobacteriota bacterium]
MKKILSGLLLLTFFITAIQIQSIDVSAQSAVEDYKKGRQSFLTFTPEGFKNAIAYYNKAIQADPKYAPAYAGLGELYSFQGFYRYEVKEDYEKYFIDSYENMKIALKINPNLEPVQLALAYTYLHLSNEKLAINAAQGVLSKNPNNAEALYILWAAKGQNPSNPEIKKALELNPKLVPALIGLGTAYYEKRRSYGQAATYYRQAAEIAPSREIHNYLGNSLIYQGYYPQAIKQFQSAIKLDPNYASAYQNMGIAYYYMNKPQDTIKSQKKAISLNPNSPDAYYFLAQGYDKTKNTQQAISYYNQFLQHSLGQDEYSIYVKAAQQRLAALGGRRQ